MIAVLAAAGPAEAHTLKIHRGEKASLRAEDEHCQPVDPYCETYSVDNCRRPDLAGHSKHWGRHKVDCEITMAGSDDAEHGGPWHCHWVDEWSIRKGENRLLWSNLVYAQTYDKCPYDTPAASRPAGA
jgi:hypothetical protein